MSWKRFATTVSAAAIVTSLAWTGTASAVDDEFGRSGPYLVAGASYAFENFDGIAGQSSPDDAWGYHLAGGFRFNEWFALEISGEHYPGFDDSTGDVEIWVAALNGKFYPLHGFIQPYLAVGAGWSGVEDTRAGPSETNSMGFAARFAGGLEVYFHRNFGAFLEASYFLPTGSKREDFDMVPLSFGVFYRFF
jgi:hypothetical protein